MCEEIELYEEILISKDKGDSNIGNKNTGHWNTGDKNTGSWNIGNKNIGHWNAGNKNTGNSNTGDSNTGYKNIGHWNAGNQNIGHWNVGSWNIGSYHSGYFGLKEAPVYMFGKPTNVNRCDLDHDLINKLGKALQSNELFDTAPFLALPNATEARIKKLHEAWIAHRKSMAKGGRSMNWQTIEKTCIICGAAFQRGKGISTEVWNAKRCCCRNCSNYLRRKPLTDLARQTSYYLNRRVETEKGVKTTYL